MNDPQQFEGFEEAIAQGTIQKLELHRLSNNKPGETITDIDGILQNYLAGNYNFDDVSRALSLWGGSYQLQAKSFRPEGGLKIEKQYNFAISRCKNETELSEIAKSYAININPQNVFNPSFNRGQPQFPQMQGLGNQYNNPYSGFQQQFNQPFNPMNPFFRQPSIYEMPENLDQIMKIQMNNIKDHVDVRMKQVEDRLQFLTEKNKEIEIRINQQIIDTNRKIQELENSYKFQMEGRERDTRYNIDNITNNHHNEIEKIKLEFNSTISQLKSEYQIQLITLNGGGKGNDDILKTLLVTTENRNSKNMELMYSQMAAQQNNPMTQMLLQTALNNNNSMNQFKDTVKVIEQIKSLGSNEDENPWVKLATEAAPKAIDAVGNWFAQKSTEKAQTEENIQKIANQMPTIPIPEIPMQSVNQSVNNVSDNQNNNVRDFSSVKVIKENQNVVNSIKNEISNSGLNTKILRLKNVLIKNINKPEVAAIKLKEIIDEVKQDVYSNRINIEYTMKLINVLESDVKKNIEAAYQKIGNFVQEAVGFSIKIYENQIKNILQEYSKIIGA